MTVSSFWSICLGRKGVQRRALLTSAGFQVPSAPSPHLPEWHIFGWHVFCFTLEGRWKEGRKEGEEGSLEPVVSGEDGYSRKNDGQCRSHRARGPRLALRSGMRVGMRVAVSLEAAPSASRVPSCGFRPMSGIEQTLTWNQHREE